MTNKNNAPADLTNLDFCVATTGNREALENLLESIVGRYPNASISVADNSQLDRLYYKALATELAEAGLLNRLRMYQAPYNADAATVRNYLASHTTGKYKLFLTEDMVLGEDTDIAAMVAVLDEHPSVGVVVGGVDGKLTMEKQDVELAEKGKPTIFRTTRIASPFIMVHVDVLHRVRFDAADPVMARFAAAMPTNAGFAIAAIPDVFIHLQKEDAKTKTPTETNPQAPQTPEPAGPDSGDATKPTVPSADAGNEAGGNSVHGGQAAPEANKTTGGGQGRGSAGPVRGK